MMKKSILVSIVFLVAFCFQVLPVMATPLDLSGFSGDATEAGGTITFVDDFSNTWYAYSNPNFLVADDACLLSFDYTLDLEPDDINDYLALEIDYAPVLTVTEQGAGHLTYDLSDYRGETIDLAWVLWWGLDAGAMGSSATVFNIDLSTSGTCPVPEPSAMLVLCLGIAGLPFLKKRRSAL